MLQQFKKVTLLAAAVLFSLSAVFAQEQEAITDEEVELFANAYEQIISIDQKAQEDMIKSVEDAGLEVNRFNEIYEAMQSPEKDAETSEEEYTQFENAMESVQTIQSETQAAVEKIVTDEGLSMERYQYIAALAQGNPELQQKIQQHLN